MKATIVTMPGDGVGPEVTAVAVAVLNAVAAQFGIDEATAQQAVTQALPGLLGGMAVNASSEEGAASLIRLAQLQASERAGEKATIGQKLQTVMGHVKSAADVLQTV